MKWRAALLPVSAALALSCGPSVPASPPLPLRASVPVTSAPVPVSALPAIPPSRVALSAPEPVSLEISSILAVWGDDSAVFVSQFANQRASYFQRVDGSKNQLGPIVTLLDENVFAAFARGNDLVIASTTRHDPHICLTTYQGAEVSSRRCEAKSGTVLLPLGERFVILKAIAPDPDAATKKPGDGAKEKKHPSAKARAKEPNRKSARSGSNKRKQATHVEVKVAADPHKLSLDRQLLTSDGTLDGESEPTGLEFTAPLAGMDLVTGTSNGSRIRALYYEWAGSVINARTGVLGKGRLALGSLDETGTYDDTSRAQLSDSDLMFGYLADHQEPRIYSTRRGALYLGLLSGHGKSEVRVVSPFSMPLIVDDSMSLIDPRAYFDIAETVRATQKSGEPIGRAGFPTPLTVAPALTAARRAYAEPDYDPGRTVGWGNRAYAMSGDDAVTFEKTDAVTTLPRPLRAQRSRTVSAAFSVDGSGLAELEHGLATVDSQGNVIGNTDTSASDNHVSRSDVAAVSRRSFVKVAGQWWQSRGALRAMQHAKPTVLRDLPPDSAVLVGGPSTGLILELRDGSLGVERFDPGDSKSRPLGRRSAPVRVGFDAVERAAGGAIVAGVSIGANPHVVSFVIDSDGHTGPSNDTGLAIDPEEPAVRLVALPQGGAFVTDMDRKEVVWLDDAARPVAKAAWPGASVDAHCVDGWPAPKTVPSPEPGKLIEPPGFAAPGTCISGDIAWAPDGSLRWFGNTSSGPHVRAELGRISMAPITRESPRAVDTIALEPPTSARCPSDMVLVAGRLCIDRFEDALAERSSGELISGDVASTVNFSSVAMSEWSTRHERVGDLLARAMPLPFVMPLQLSRNIDVVAVSRMGIRPSGYVTGLVARAACEASGKRLCSWGEWKTACRGESDTLFPYGPDYQEGACNVNREAHPAALLHGHSSIGHLDPRLNYATSNGSPLFHRTAESPSCMSRWGNDGVYDMVGNVDEWVDEGGGAFAGGFYSRGTKAGCGALVENHPQSYLDYSTGVRCCRDVSP